MTSLPSDVQVAAEFYDHHYAAAPADPIVLVPGRKLILGKKESPRSCRFCGNAEPKVSFKDDAHAFPAAFGNTGLFSYYECDVCNHLFGEGIENHLGNWSKPMRTISFIRGRNGVPTIKQPGPGRGWRLEAADSGFKMTAYEDDPFFKIDEKTKQLRFELHRDTYIPVAALKGLVKIGLTLLPDSEIEHFRETFGWIRETDHTQPFVSSFPVFRTFTPGPTHNDQITLWLFRRRAGVDTVPYAFFIFAYGNEMLQVFLPSIPQDECIYNQKLSLIPFPAARHIEDQAHYGRPVVSILDLTGRTPVKGEKVPVVMGFEEIKSER